MSKQRGTIEKYQNTAVTLGSGLKVEFDRTIHPKDTDVRYVMQKLFKSRYIDEITPAYAVPELFVRYTNEQLKELIPYVLRSLDELVRDGDIFKDDELLVTTCATVLAWYQHWNFGGTRPIFVTPEEKKREAYRRKITPTRPDLRCPFCNKVYPDTDKYTRYSVLARHWTAWLVKHYKQYHKEWGDDRLVFQDPIIHTHRTKEEKPES